MTALLSKHFNDIFDADTFVALSSIAFLPCQVPSASAEEAKTAKFALCRPCDIVLEKDRDLSWTVSPVLTAKMP